MSQIGGPRGRSFWNGVADAPTEGNIVKIVIIGGTGLIGSKVAQRLTAQGHEVVAASPNTGVNTLTGEGVAEALDGAQVVIDVSNSPSFAADEVLAFFETSTRNLLAAEQAAGVGHHVALSIVGSDGLPDSGYMRAKVAQERLIRDGGVPYSIVHATQFMEFGKAIADGATDGETVRIAPVRFRPIASDDVADAVAAVATGEPVNGDVEIAGPEEFRFDEFIADALAARGDERTVVADPEAEYFGTRLDDGSLVPADAATARLGATTFAQWKAAQAAAPAR
ncbi:SDR family oxidoreductase [Agromyces mariniharenae]|uniref:SDR family oxidoreductase n=1 Tax=Agromyces mariniharenae TaxID=2604423 RepID=UPI003082B4E1